MCSPTAAMVGVNVGSSVLGHAAKNKAASERNKQRAAAYRAEKAKIIKQHNVDVTNYYLRGADAEIDFAETTLEGNQKVQEQQLLLNESIADEFRQTETDYVEMISNQRIAASLERSGKSAGRIARAAQAVVGRAAAGRASDTERARDTAKLAFQQIRRAQDSDMRDAFLQIGSVPVRGADPAKPVWDKGPGMLGLIGGVAAGVASGYVQDKQLKTFESIRNQGQIGTQENN